jgi:FAD/FMN-containing dehydrogenase
MGTGGKTVKNVSGYDLSKLMIGAMGTLGVLCEMTLRLLPLPERMETCILTFESLSHAMDFADRLFNTPLLPAAVEAVNRHLLQVVCEKQKGGPPAGSYGILIALEGVHEAVDRMHRELPIMAQQCGVMERIVLEEGAHSRFWREIGGLQAQAASRWSEMVSLRMNYPRAQWRSLVFRTEELLASSGMSHYLLCHAGSGVCRVDILLEGGARKEKEANAVSAVARTLLAACRAAGGNLTVPLAPTEMKPHLPVWGEPPPDLPLMRRVRFEMDPSERMSPGRTPWTPLLP